MCKYMARQLSLDAAVYESQETSCEAERELEALRLETVALRQELLHQLDAAKDELDLALASRRKCEKLLAKLESECRRLEEENQQLRDELKKSKRNIRSKSELPAQFRMVSTYSQATSPEKEDTGPQLTMITWQLEGLKSTWREQGSKVSSCLAALRKTREDNAVILEAVSQIQDALAIAKPAFAHRSTTESFSDQDPIEVYHDEREGDYCRLMDEIQTMNNSLVLDDAIVEESLFHCHEEVEESLLIAKPIQEKMEHMEEDLAKMQESFLENLGKSGKGKKHAGTQTIRNISAVAHKRQKSSLARAYMRAVSQHWSLLA